MFGILAFVLFVIAAVVGWNGGHHADAIAYAGAASAVIELVFAWRPWVHP
jgi:hypothetical protein